MSRLPRHALGWLAALMSAALSATAFTASMAGTLCGTVRDSQTQAPIAHAGIFLRTPAGTYTGIYGASDAAGAFCIAAVPAGTYDLEVRVDDHQVAYVRGVVVTTTTDVEIPVGGTSLELLALAPAPNPARETALIAWTLRRAGPARLAIYDIRGREVRAWRSPSLAAGAHSLSWDLRDSRQVRVPPGVYFIHLEAGGAHRVRSIVRDP